MPISVNELRELAPGRAPARSVVDPPPLAARKVGVALLRGGALLACVFGAGVSAVALIASSVRKQDVETRPLFEAPSSPSQLQKQIDTVVENAPHFDIVAWFSRGFRESAARDLARIETNRVAPPSSWITMKWGSAPKSVAPGGGLIDTNELGENVVAELRLSTEASLETTGSMAANVVKPRLTAPLGRRAAPASESPARKQPAATRAPARQERAEPPQIAAAPAPAPKPVSPPAVGDPFGPPLPPTPSVTEQSMRDAIAAADADFRLADTATERFRQYAALHASDAAALAPLEQEVIRLTQISNTAIAERSQFDPARDELSGIALTDVTQTALTACFDNIPTVRQVFIARRDVVVQSSIPAYMAIVRAPIDTKSLDRLVEATRQCVLPLNTRGTVALLVNSDAPEADATARRIAARQDAFVFDRDKLFGGTRPKAQK